MAIVQRLRNRYFFALDLILLVTAVIFSYILRPDTFSFDQVGPGFLFFTGGGSHKSAGASTAPADPAFVPSEGGSKS